MVILPTLYGRVLSRSSERRRGSKCLAMATGLFLAASSPALCQEQVAPGGGSAAPAREGNIYGHVDHQPTEAEIGKAAEPGSVDSPSAVNREQVDEEVDQLLQQSRELDEAAEKQGKDYPAGSSSGPAAAGSTPR